MSIQGAPRFFSSILISATASSLSSVIACPCCNERSAV